MSPIPKVDKPKVESDFRPISMLPMLSKIFEKIVSVKWLTPSIRDKVNLNQFAYVPGCGKGTVMATTSMYLKCLKSLDQQSGCVRMATIDLRKAFDRLTHHSIIQACVRFNLSKNLTQLIMSFLSKRLQRVFFNNSLSSWANVTSGVPQGSVMGPILFCMVVDDLTPACHNSTYYKYADDLTILNVMYDSDQDNLQLEIDNVVNWCKTKNLDLNLSKCNVMDISTKKSLSGSSVRVVNNNFLTEVPCINILGCVFSSDLKWDRHILKYVSKASRRIHLIVSLKRAGCSPDLLYYVYCSCIRPLLIYCFPTVCNMPKLLKNKLSNVEKRIFRIIGPYDNELPSLLSVADTMCDRIFQSVVDNPQHPLRAFFDERLCVTTRNSCPLRRPRTRTQRFLNSFIRYCP